MTKQVNVKGTIIPNDVKFIYDLFDIDSTSPNDINDVIDNNGDEIEVIVNSGGGDVFSGSEIYTALKDSNHKVTVKVTGIGASSASVIAMAGDEVQMSPTAQIMIHNVSSGAQGDYKELKHESDVIKNYNKSIASAYVNKTGKSEQEILNLMDKETWLTAQQAKEQGFIDKVMFEDDNNQNMNLVASNNATILPQAVIDKVKNDRLDQVMEYGVTDDKSQEEDNTTNDVTIEQQQAQAKLNLLKLK
ncbi:Clp protease ClpP [Barrientosiimonas marina]|uniref:ATP-dependent Clp protease proteolytic subunit n=1 Tax=Lentibacillus kimchii TaxID=1542911 RepID=A0ABW2UZ09_9BACI